MSTTISSILREEFDQWIEIHGIPESVAKILREEKGYDTLGVVASLSELEIREMNLPRPGDTAKLRLAVSELREHPRKMPRIAVKLEHESQPPPPPPPPSVQPSSSLQQPQLKDEKDPQSTRNLARCSHCHNFVKNTRQHAATCHQDESNKCKSLSTCPTNYIRGHSIEVAEEKRKEKEEKAREKKLKKEQQKEKQKKLLEELQVHPDPDLSQMQREMLQGLAPGSTAYSEKMREIAREFRKRRGEAKSEKSAVTTIKQEIKHGKRTMSDDEKIEFVKKRKSQLIPTIDLTLSSSQDDQQQTDPSTASSLAASSSAATSNTAISNASTSSSGHSHTDSSDEDI